MSKKVFRDLNNSKPFVINRNKWLRALPNMFLNSKLLDSQTDKMCCLGFYARACGISKQNINDLAYPHEVQVLLKDKNHRWETFLVGDNTLSNDNTLSAERLMQINDDPSTDDKFKEKRIKEIFSEQGIKVKFVNEE